MYLLSFRWRVIGKSREKIIHSAFHEKNSVGEVRLKECYRLILDRYDKLMLGFKHEEIFSDEQMLHLQYDCDQFIRAYFQIPWHTESNYIHILKSGKPFRFLKIYGILCIFSNDGLEAYMGQLRSFCIKRTNKKGISMTQTVGRYISRENTRKLEELGHESLEVIKLINPFNTLYVLNMIIMLTRI